MTDSTGAEPDRGRSLDPIFRPRGVAVVGASRDRRSIGWALLHNLVMAELEAPIYPVNPHARVVHSLPCFPRLSAIPGPVDLAIVVVPAGTVPSVVDDGLACGVRGLVVISAGFGETGAAGAAAEAGLVERVRAAGVRMIGPNCMGVINTDPTVRLDATFSPTSARPGGVGFVSQSGALGVAILNVAADLGLGISQFVSVGNKADVSGNDLLEYWEHDDATRVVAMYLESFGNPRRFTEIAKRVGRRKPILVVKSGRTEAGARAASSHTGALAGSDLTVSTFLDQCGVLRADTIEALFDTARAFDRCPLPAGPRVAVVTNAGGPGIMATDALVSHGLTFAALAPATVRGLRSFLPRAASVANPIDMIASASAEDYARALHGVLEDPGVDMALVINVTPLIGDPSTVLERVSAVSGRCPGKPVVAVMMAQDAFFADIRERRELVPVYRFPESASRALAQLHRYAAWRRRPVDAAAPRFDVDDEAVAKRLADHGSGELPAEGALCVLEAYGIATASWRTVAATDDLDADTEAVCAAAEAVGFPVVLKASAPGLVHKRDVGGVALDLRDPASLRWALGEMAESLERAERPPSAWLVQRSVTDGRELILGVVTDPRFGPLLMVGLGGVYVEVFRDVAFAVPPLGRAEAFDMLRRLRGFELLEGVRGDGAVDLDHLVEVLQRLGQLVARHPSIRELDVNPYLAATDGGASMALDARLRVGDR